MSLDDDYYDLRDFLESFENDKDRICMLGCLDRINDFNNQVAEDNKELRRQLVALKAAIVVLDAADVKITEPYCEAGRYINLELKNLESDKGEKDIV